MAVDHMDGGLTDRLNRPLRDLRLSITDRCNLRCTYCMPEESFVSNDAFLPKADLLTFDEMMRVVEAAATLGVEKLRVTGGEPLLRAGVESFIERVSNRSLGLDLALTTNGLLLARKARRLKAAGLHRVTVSLDALDAPTFARMSGRSESPAEVLRGIDAARAAGFAPPKINTVVCRGVNEHAIVDIAQFFRHRGEVVRFIEYMDVGGPLGWRPNHVVPAAEILHVLHRQWPLSPVAPLYPGEVAKRYRYDDGGGEIGIIASVTHAFCGDCQRLRMSADGTLYTCLFSRRGTPLRPILRAGEGVAARQLTDAIASVWSGRADRYSELRNHLAEPSRHAARSGSWNGIVNDIVRMHRVGG